MNVKDINNLKRIWAFNGNFAIYETTMGKAGLINRQGEVIFPADKYEFGFYIENDLYNFQVADSVVPAIFFDANLRKKVEQPERSIIEKPQLPSFAEKLDGAYWCANNCIAYKENGCYGIMDEKGNVLVTPKYASISSAAPYNFKNDRMWVKNLDGQMGYIDLNGEELIPCQYRYIIWCRRIGVYKFENFDCKWGFMNSVGRVIVPAIYDSIDASETYGLNEIAVSKDNRCYFINENQDEIIIF